ncbi:MAG: hypothetical protein ACI4XL_08930 [Bacillus sp. (in: firmicutes)]
MNFAYEFTSDKEIISNKNRSDVSAIMAVDVLFTVKINEDVYFEAELSILEFYKALAVWKDKVIEGDIPEFHYYTIEFDEYEEREASFPCCRFQIKQDLPPYGRRLK